MGLVQCIVGCVYCKYEKVVGLWFQSQLVQKRVRKRSVQGQSRALWEIWREWEGMMCLFDGTSRGFISLSGADAFRHSALVLLRWSGIRVLRKSDQTRRWKRICSYRLFWKRPRASRRTFDQRPILLSCPSLWAGVIFPRRPSFVLRRIRIRRCQDGWRLLG